MPHPQQYLMSGLRPMIPSGCPWLQAARPEPVVYVPSASTLLLPKASLQHEVFGLGYTARRCGNTALNTAVAARFSSLVAGTTG